MTTLAVLRQEFDALNHDYLAIHKAKEDLFWDTYMAVSDDHAGFAAAEAAFKDFISSPARLAAVQQALAQLEAQPDGEEKRALTHGYRGWLALFQSNIIESDEARRLMTGLIELEAALFAKRREFKMQHVNDNGALENATLSMLMTNMGTNRDEAARKSSHDALLGLERWALDNGFIDIVKQRNALARSLGYADYFAYKVEKNEQMTPDELFAILDDFEARTHDANQRALAQLQAKHGDDALKAHNLRFHMSGDVTRQIDPYLPFAKAVERWVLSFRRLGIQYRGATMQLDLVEREGKYQNGFCHGPIPAFLDGAAWVAGQINFTADAKPDQVGSGARAINTLFHEGGHAAHFANVAQNSPCFSQEFAPTSMAYAETQSMFCDSLLDDADWLKRYARDSRGEVIPDALIRARIEATQPFAAFAERSIAVVAYFERALYALPESELTAGRILELARASEQRILGIAVSPRPLLAIPHLLNQESAAAYHGYLLANMAVYQTRAHFLREYGYLTDNPAIGPQLARHYWAPGNSINHNATLVSLTGEPFNARYLAESCTQSVEQAWADAETRIAASAARDYPRQYPDALDARIRLVHGAELIADNGDGDEAMFHRFEAWVAQRYPASVH
ncbi:peptidase M3 [Chromobacterium subtsugae]|uniref:Peptidase M3 n=1 Tax=Chromobacterium subtsugae TaxID=251747 RepID=A0ABS7FK20_9NEIS|nr:MULTISPECIES: M3 family metallopeptidase [Chromobacterium]KUM02245.1 peptidase M3 [Chromobacterium subtsugae]KZE86200.1 peptidase M3 [Chromobacterium sp. F49]MBW7568047.1 peptidase M3 [Chromobacterium subtsugae]MBW8290071.1 peptidase M3 [Chromobacterium subtsugae]WSE91959.1 M3 family metallopeptidase [Chromobacterium subtsugae]